MPPRLRREDYTVGWVCALPVELAAAQEMLDEEHENLDRDLSDNDENLYALGSIRGHNVAIVCLPAGWIGNNPAAAVAAQMRATFKGIQFGLMVGIGGGVPGEVDIRLGDVVVSKPHLTFGGVVQYDIGKATPSGLGRTGSLNSPPQMLLAAVARVRANELRGRSRLPEHISKLERIPRFQRSKAGHDVLFEAAYDHEGGRTCEQCSADRQVVRQPRESEEEAVVVHYGTIASGNQVMRNATQRDKVSAELDGVLCFEMEAAGLINSFPCLVIRGICDYADSHKNKKWQAYAAATAAAYAKELLSVIPTVEVAKAHTVEETIPSASGPVSTPTYYIPFSQNRYFVGRRAELDVLKQRLMVDRNCQKMSVVGLGGTGKTQVALQFAYMVKETWPDVSIFWVPALSLESYEQACSDIVRALHIPQVAGEEEDAKELVKQHLSSARAGRWLLVLDNADDPDILFGARGSKGIVDYLPESKEDTQVVVYTTRILDVAVSLTRGDVLELGAMSRQDATDFLEKSLIRKDLLYDDAIRNELLDELTCLPLAVTQAAAYLNKNRMPISKYLQLLKNTEQDIVGLMSREFRDDTRYKGSTNAVATTWVVSFNQIWAHNEVAADLLAFMSCIEWKAIPRSLLPSVQPVERMEEAIGTLCGYSFLARREDDSWEEEKKEEWYDIHRLVHLATRIWIRQHGNTAEVTEKVTRHIADIFPYENYPNRLVWRAYMPHALQLLGSIQDRDIEGKLDLCLLVGRCLQADGRIREAVKWLEKCYRWTDGLGEEHPDRLASQNSLAVAYEADGQVKRAVELLEHVVAVREKVLAEENPYRLSSEHELAQAYESDAQIKKSVELLEHVVAVRERVLAEDHPNRLASQNSLAVAYEADGQVKRAVKLLEHVVAVRDRVLAEDHPSRLGSQHSLAVAYKEDGQAKRGVELLEHVVAVREKTLAEEHPYRLASQHELAGAYLADDQVKKTIELLEHVVTVRKKVLAEEHPYQLGSQHVLANAYKVDGQVKKAVELLEHVVAVREKVLAEEHTYRLSSQHELARAYLADGQAKKTIELLEHVVAIREKVLAEDHPYRLGSQHVLAQAYNDDGQAKKAIELLEHVVAVREKVLAEDNSLRLASQHELAGAYLVDGQAKKTIELLEHVVAIREKILAEDHPYRLGSQHVLAQAYNDGGQAKKAVELLEHVVTVREKVLAEDHQHRLASQRELADAYKKDGQVKKAVELLEHVVAVREKVLAEDDPIRLESQRDLAEAVELLEYVVVAED